MSAALADRNRMLGNGTWTDVGGTFSGPPIQNLGEHQTPSPRAEFTGTTAEFQFQALDAADAAETFKVQSLGLIGHTLPDGALIEWLRADGSLIAAQTWRRYSNRPRNSYILLPATETLDTIRCRITGVPSGTYGIAAAWAGELLYGRAERGWEQRNNDNSGVTRVDGTAWTFAASRQRGIPVTFPLMTYADAFGVPLPGTNLGLPVWDINNSTSESDGVYTFSAVSGTLLSADTALTAGQWNRVTVNLTQDPANTAIVTANLGTDGKQALQPGQNTIVAEAVDATLLFEANAAFTGTLEITKIEQLATGLTGDDIQSRLDEAGTHSPIIYFPRTQSQQWIQSNAIYGLLEDGGRVTHGRGPFHTAEFRILEQS